jgi:BolA protein
MPMADTIRRKLEAAFAPTELRIEDESAKHAGHAGARPGGETHFSVRLVSQGFAGLSRVARQRSVYAALAEEMAPDRIHALALTTLTPSEASQERQAPAGSRAGR